MQKSFDEIYALHPQQLQLGFLKVLKGSYMYENQNAYGLLYRKRAPYEVLATRWLGFDEVLKIRSVEEMVELHYNSHQFEQALHILETECESYFQMYRTLARFYEAHVPKGQSFSRLRRAELLAEFAAEAFPEKKELVEEALLFDLYARENIKRRPAWATDLSEWKKTELAWLRSQGKDKKYCHLERFSFEFVKRLFPDRAISDSGWVFFDYETRDPLTNTALIYPVDIMETVKKDT